MSDLNLHFNSAENDDVALAKAINRRAYGWWQWQLPTLASVLAFAIAAVPAVVATAGPSLLTLWLMPCFAFVVARDLSTRVLKRHLRSRVSASPINRPRQTNLALTAEGLSDDMMRVPWSFVTGQFRLSHMTIVQFSPPHGYPIPDTALPADLSPDAFARKIDQWRTT